MTTQRLLITFLFLMLYSCSMDNPKQHKEKTAVNLESDSTELPEPQFVTELNEKEIISVTDTLYKGDTLKIIFKTPHSKDLAITTPDEKFFFVVYGLNDTTKPSLVDWNEFANLSTLSIITNKTKVNPWDAGIDGNQIIFTKTGNYQIKLSENLETDDGTPVEIETVY